MGNDQQLTILTKILARGSMINIVGFAVRSVLLFIHGIVAVRFFGIGAYGLYGIGLAIVSIASLFGQLGFSSTLTRFVSIYLVEKENQKISTILLLALGIALPVSILLGMLLYFKADSIASVFGSNNEAGFIQIFGFSIPLLTLVHLITGFTQGFKIMRYKVIAQDIIAPIIELSMLIMLKLVANDARNLPIAYAISNFISSIFLVYFVVSVIRKHSINVIKWHQGILKLPFKQIVIFSLPVLAASLLTSSTQRISNLILGAMGTTAMVGIFSIMDRLTKPGIALLTSTNLMMAPLIADLVDRNRIKDLSGLYKISTRWLSIVSTPFFLIIGFWSREILKLFGDKVGSDANMIWYLIFALIFNISTGSCGNILKMAGYPHYNAFDTLMNLIIVVLVEIVLVPIYGLLGAILAVAIGMIVTNILRMVQVWQKLNIHPYSFPLLKAVAAGLIMSFLLAIYKNQFAVVNKFWISFMVGNLLSFFTYIGVLLVLGLEPNEMQILNGFRRRVASIFSS